MTPDPRPPDDVEPWPRWLRTTALATLLAVIGIGFVVALYDRGWLPLTGPFVAALLVPLILRGRGYALDRRRRRLSEALRGQLLEVRAGVALEAGQPPGSRATGATDLDLSLAATYVGEALAGLDAADLAGAEQQLTLLDRTRARWRPDAATTVRAAEAATTCAALVRTVAQSRSLGRRSRAGGER